MLPNWSLAQAICDLNSELSHQLLLPVGWHTEVHKLQTGEACVWFPQRPGDIWGFTGPQGCVQLKDAPASQNAGLLAKLLGLALTALAVSQGVPFWFDLFSKLGNMRSAGPVPATSAEKAKEKLEQGGRGEAASLRS